MTSFVVTTLLNDAIDHSKCSPVNDASIMEEEKSQDDFGRVESRSVLVKLAGSLDLEHEVAPIDILHHEEQPLLVAERRGFKGENGIMLRWSVRISRYTALVYGYIITYTQDCAMQGVAITVDMEL